MIKRTAGKGDFERSVADDDDNDESAPAGGEWENGNLAVMNARDAQPSAEPRRLAVRVASLHWPRSFFNGG